MPLTKRERRGAVSPVRGDIDHLVYAVPDLDRGIDEMAERLGVRPATGGRHPHFGTHNALVSLGPKTYLEIIARDPTLPRPERGIVFGLEELLEPRLATWVLRREDIEDAAAAAAQANIGLGAVQTGSRTRPDGAIVAWRVTDPYAMPLDGAVPFLIAWGDTPHPAASAPPAGELVGLRIEHPEPGQVAAALAAIGAQVEVEPGARSRLVAHIRTAAGEVEIG
jgi:hypothetical protein